MRDRERGREAERDREGTERERSTTTFRVGGGTFQRGTVRRSFYCLCPPFLSIQVGILRSHLNMSLPLYLLSTPAPSIFWGSLGGCKASSSIVYLTVLAEKPCVSYLWFIALLLSLLYAVEFVVYCIWPVSAGGSHPKWKLARFFFKPCTIV